MSKKTLLLNSGFQVISFVPERKAIKLIFKDKVEVISNWDDVITWGSGKINHPSILRLKVPIKRNYYNSNFSRKAIVRRDDSQCQYCGLKLNASQITIDHIVPRAQGGINSFINCVVACHACNNKKSAFTPEQAGITLLRKPYHPSFSANNYVADPQDNWDPEWDFFLR